MNLREYELLIDNDAVARVESLEYAVIFIKALFEEYYNDETLAIEVRPIFDGVIDND